MRGVLSGGKSKQCIKEKDVCKPEIDRLFTRLVLPFERHIKGEDDKPLPPSKPRKPYKRNQEGKMNKADGKRKRSSSEREMDSEVIIDSID